MWIYIFTDQYGQMERDANTLSFFQSGTLLHGQVFTRTRCLRGVLDVDRRLVACAWGISRDLPDAAVLHSSTSSSPNTPSTPFHTFREH